MSNNHEERSQINLHKVKWNLIGYFKKRCLTGTERVVYGLINVEVYGLA